MLDHKNQFKFENTAFLFVANQICIFMLFKSFLLLGPCSNDYFTIINLIHVVLEWPNVHKKFTSVIASCERFRATVTLVLLYLVLLGDMFSLHQIPTLRSVNDVTEGSTQEAHMCAS